MCTIRTGNGVSRRGRNKCHYVGQGSAGKQEGRMDSTIDI